MGPCLSLEEGKSATLGNLGLGPKVNQRSVIECLEANYAMTKPVTFLRSFSPLFFAFIRERSYFLAGLALDMKKTIMNRTQEDPVLMESALQE